MLTEFSKDNTRTPLVTYIIMMLALVVTTANLMSNQYEEFLSDSEILRLFLLPFHHGFNFMSSILHLSFSLIFVWYFGKIVEKILGRKFFIMICLIAYLVYVVLQYTFSMTGYGLTPLIFCIVVYAFAAMTEAKDIKPRVVHEPFFTRVNSISIAFILTSLLLFSFLPIFYDVKNTGLIKGVFDGNFLHLIEALLGLISLVFLRRKLRANWIRFNKRKSFRTTIKSKKVVYS